MISKAIVIALLAGPAAVRADDLVLKDGKAIHGKITAEDAQEITIETGSKMVLRVERSKILKVNRDDQKTNRPTLRMQDLPKASTATAAKTPVSPATGKAVGAAAPANPGASSPVPVARSGEHNLIKKDAVLYERTLVMGTTTSWAVSWDGAPEKTRDQAKWKWAVVSTTITVLPSSPLAAGVRDIYSGESESFADELSVLRSADEKTLRRDSDRLFATMHANVVKKKQGLERRTKKAFDIPQK